MKSAKIYPIFDAENESLITFLDNIGSVVKDIKDANVILSDNEKHICKGYLNFVITSNSGKEYISIPPDSDAVYIYQAILHVLSVIDFCDYHESEKDDNLEEQDIVGGFARHFSHNVLNALLMASGFIRLIKANSVMTDQLAVLWKSVDQKLSFIEELVSGYSDYYQVLNIKMTNDIEINTTFYDIIVSIATKSFDKSFSAYLDNYKDLYNLTYDFCELEPYFIKANLLFFKLGICYIIKDTVKYVYPVRKCLNFHVRSCMNNGRYEISILVKDLNISKGIVDTMFKPWDHKIFVQSFDYWGIVIAQTIFHRHGGSMTVENFGNDLKYTIIL